MTKNNENVTKILDSVDDKILAKKKLKRTIISSVILSAVVVISAVIIALANINTTVYPQFLNNAHAYEIHISNQQVYIGEDSNNYKNFLDVYSKNFSTDVLTAMFTGKLNGYTIEESKDSFYSNGTEKTGMSSLLNSKVGSEYIKISYKQGEDQKVTHKNGSQYYSTRYEAFAFALNFQDCYVKLDKENSNNIVAYIGTYDPDKGDKNPTITTITISASSSALYEDLIELFNI